MLTRRGLFSLLPAPFAGLASGLLTVSPDVAEAPESDPVAVAALAVAEGLNGLETAARIVECWRNPVGGPSCYGLTRSEVEDFSRRQNAYANANLADAETRLRAEFRRTRGLSIVIGGRVYSADRTRAPQVVEARWVALLTPKGGA